MQQSLSTQAGELLFEEGKLVKINGARPDYMDGNTLIRMVKLIANELLCVQSGQSNSQSERAAELEKIRAALREARRGLAMWNMETKFIDDALGDKAVYEDRLGAAATRGGSASHG